MQEIIVTSTKRIREIIFEIFTDYAENQAQANGVKENLQNQRYHSRKETAKILQISLPTLNKYVKKSIIDCHRIGNRVLFRQEDIDKAIIKRNFSKNDI